MGILQTIKRAFVKTLRDLWKVIRYVFSEYKEEILAGLLPIALEIVKELMGIHLSGEEKRAEAYKRIMKIAKRKGIVPKNHEIFLSIELAVAKIKKENEKVLTV